MLPARTTPGSRTAGVLAAVAVMAAAAALIVWKVVAQIAVGPRWDTYAFLANAAEFAGRGFGYTEPHRPPALPFLTSLVFRFTGLRIEAIQWVDGALTLSGVLAVYLLVRHRSDRTFAAIGALMLLAVTPLWRFIGVGYTDAAAVALCTWLLLVLVRATEKNPAWLLLAGPLFVSAAMMRFTAILFGFVCLVWMGFRASFFRHAWGLLVSAVLGIALYSPAGIYYVRRFGEGLFPFIVAFGFAEAVAVPGGESTSQSGLYYLAKSAVLLGPQQLALLTVFVMLVAFAALVTSLGAYFERTRPRLRVFAYAALCIAPAIVAQLQGGLALRQLTIAVGVFGVWRLFSERDQRNRSVASAALDATMVAWLLAYADFHGHQSVQVARYFIAMAVPAVYLVVRGWDIAASRLAEAASASGQPGRSGAVYGAVAGFLALYVTGSLVLAVTSTPRSSYQYVAAGRDTASWLKAQPGIAHASVSSEIWPYTAWYLQRDVRPMPSLETPAAYQHELDKTGARYFVTLRRRPPPNYRETFATPIATVLARSSEPTLSVPRVQYLGKSWDNYLERLTGFDFYLLSTAGRYGWEGSAFLDALTADELARSDAVAIYGVKWHSRADGERALQEYVERGGSVVLDGSQNLDEPAYGMAGTVAFDAVVRQGTLPANAQLTVDPAFAAKHGLDPVIASSFVDEGGGAWAGASYVERPGTPALRTLVRAGDKPVVSVRDVGKGRVYFIGYNLPWHAFSKRNDSEAALIRAIFADAIEHTQATQEAP